MVGRTRSATFGVERGKTLELVRGVEDGDTKKATVTIDDDIVRIRLSELAWRPALVGDLAGYHAIRVNDQYRVIFRFDGTDAHDVRCTDYH